MARTLSAAAGWKARRSRRLTPIGAGFTLVELLVALLVMAVLSVMAWRGIDGMARTGEVTQARADALLSLQSGLQQWGADLDALAEPASFSTGGPSGAAALDWNGQTLRLVRSVQELPAGTRGQVPAQPGLRVVAWSLRTQEGSSQWLRWQSVLLSSRAEVQTAWQAAAQWAQNPSASLRQDELVMAPALQWQVFYYRADAWSNPQSSNDASASIPDGVRLRLTLPPEHPLAGVLVRDWIRPQVGANKS